MTKRYERRRSRVGCLAWLVAIVWILLLAVLAYRFLFRQQVSQYIGNQIGGQLNAQQGAQPSAQAGGQIGQGLGSALPTAIAALPSGELHISEAAANDYIAARADSLKPIQSAKISFVPGEIRADIQALGTTSRATMRVAVENGRIIAVNPQLDGVLGQFISPNDLIKTLENQLNDQLAAQGRRATDVRVEQGELIVTIEG
jgi:hypothetical protein